MRRLREGSMDGVAHEILSSAKLDAPSAHARERTAMALGLLAGATETAATASASTAGGLASGATTAPGAGLAATTTSASVAGLTGASLVMKAAGLFLAAGLLTTGVILTPKGAPSARTTPNTVASVAVAAVTEHPARTPQASAPEQVPGGPRAAEALPVLRSALPAASNAPVVSRSAGFAVPSLGRTVAPPAASALDLTHAMTLLETARAALDAGDAVAALRIVNDYERTFPGGALAPEATVLRIEALVANGAEAEATRVAEAFLATSPDSPHARHVTALLASIHERHANR